MEMIIFFVKSLIDMNDQETLCCVGKCLVILIDVRSDIADRIKILRKCEMNIRRCLFNTVFNLILASIGQLYSDDLQIIHFASV